MYIFLVANKLQFHSASFRLIDDLSIGFCSYTISASEKRMARKKEHPCTKLKLYFHGHVRFAIVGQPCGRDLVLSFIPLGMHCSGLSPAGYKYMAFNSCRME